MSKDTLYALHGVAFKAKIDKENKVIHLLDQDGTISLTNRIDPSFLESLQDRLGIAQYLQFRFICYHTDLTITEFMVPDNFILINPNDPIVDDEFKKEMFYIYG